MQLELDRLTQPTARQRRRESAADNYLKFERFVTREKNV
jgi:hypothetical protein